MRRCLAQDAKRLKFAFPNILVATPSTNSLFGEQISQGVPVNQHIAVIQRTGKKPHEKKVEWPSSGMQRHLMEEGYRPATKPATSAPDVYEKLYSAALKKLPF